MMMLCVRINRKESVDLLNSIRYIRDVSVEERRAKSLISLCLRF